MLTNTSIKNAKPKKKDYKLYDEKGLYLLIAAKGAKYWRFRYRVRGKEKLLALGVYPEVSLKEARDKRDDARLLLRDGVDPSAAKQEQKRTGTTFKEVALEWYERQSNKWSEAYAFNILRCLERNVFPHLGAEPINDITAPQLLAVLRKVEVRGALDILHRTHQTCGRIFRYAIACGLAERDVAADLRGSLTPQQVKHHASLTNPKDVAGLLRAIESFEGSPLTKWALKLSPLLFVRPGELRHAEWSEIDLDAAEWRIPAEKMKMKEQHIVPLSKQAVAIFLEAQELTGQGKYVFPSLRSKDRPMSNNTVNAALRRMGYSKEEMTAHGFRSMASTLLNEMGWNRDAIERQLAHAERDKVRAAYNFADYLPERVKMMQAWANYLDKLRTGAKVTPIRANMS